MTADLGEDAAKVKAQGQGLPRKRSARLVRVVAGAAARGFGVASHAIGNAAIPAGNTGIHIWRRTRVVGNQVAGTANGHVDISHVAQLTIDSCLFAANAGRRLREEILEGVRLSVVERTDMKLMHELVSAIPGVKILFPVEANAVFVEMDDPRLAARCDRLVELIDGRIARDEAITEGVEPAPHG